MSPEPRSYSFLKKKSIHFWTLISISSQKLRKINKKNSQILSLRDGKCSAEVLWIRGEFIGISSTMMTSWWWEIWGIIRKGKRKFCIFDLLEGTNRYETQFAVSWEQCIPPREKNIWFNSLIYPPIWVKYSSQIYMQSWKPEIVV